MEVFRWCLNVCVKTRIVGYLDIVEVMVVDLWNESRRELLERLFKP